MAKALDPKSVGQALSWLDQNGFARTSRWPLFTARCWSPLLEHRAWKRYRQGLCNLEEVAIPRWYWRHLPSRLAQLFRVLTLGQSVPDGGIPPELRELLSATGEPYHKIIPRFGRYVLASRGNEEGDEHVYFGDDTLYLMQRGRELLELVPRAPGSRVLDLCCGGGGVGLALSPFRGTLLGVDINPAAIALASLAASAQGLRNYRYHLGSVEEVMDETYDLVIGNPPTLPPELGGTSTVYATGPTGRWLDWLEKLQARLSPGGRLLVTAFSVADGPGAGATDALRPILAQRLSRAYLYTIRRQYPLTSGRWLRHVALELLPEGEEAGERFVEAAPSFQLPALPWRRGS